MCLRTSGPYLDERVDDSYVRTGVEHFVEVGLPVDELQLVELLIVLQEDSHVSCINLICRKQKVVLVHLKARNKHELEYFPFPTLPPVHSTHITSSAVTYHQFLDERFSLRHHVLQLSDDLQILRTTLPVPELLLCSFQPGRQRDTVH